FLAAPTGYQGFASETRTWMMPRGRADEKQLLSKSRANVEIILREILHDPSASFMLGYRNNAAFRLKIALGDGTIIPSLEHLSAGQIVLFNAFATIIRYADWGDINRSIDLASIEGIVLIDEIDAHLHTSLQYEVLPALCRLFPKVQFI